MSPSFGLAVGNFTPASTVPTVDGLAEYARAAEHLRFDSLWVWDHLFLGSRRPFPFYEALFTIALLASHTERVTLGTGVLVLPLRDPVVLAKETATLQFVCGGRLALGVAAGWYQREFEATGISFTERGRIFEENLELLRRLWTEESVSGTYSQRLLKDVRMVPRPGACSGRVDRRVRRSSAAPCRQAGRWLADLLLHGGELRSRVGEDPVVRRAGRSGSRRAQQRRPTADLRRRLVRGGRPAGASVRRGVLRHGCVE